MGDINDMLFVLLHENSKGNGKDSMSLRKGLLMIRDSIDLVNNGPRAKVDEDKRTVI